MDILKFYNIIKFNFYKKSMVLINLYLTILCENVSEIIVTDE